MDYDVRKWVGYVEEISHDGGAPAGETLIKAVAAAVIRNPFAGRYQDDLTPLTDPSAELGAVLAERAKLLLGGRPAESYGKGGIAGVDGEQEHVVACVTTPYGDAMRAAVGGGEAWVSSVTKVGSAGEPLDLPLAYKDALYVRSHYDAVSLRIPDAPRPDELVIAVALATGGRVHHRVGGLRREEAVGDGVR
jgi:hypothetical protein